MADQNIKNHPRLIPLWHFILPLLWLALLGGSIVNLLHAEEHNHHSAALIALIALIIGIFYWYIRAFALRAQDRAIRAEERLRHYLLTGKTLDDNLRMKQIIALRFASDAEFPGLAIRAVSEKLSPREIKKAIQNWKADYNRV